MAYAHTYPHINALVMAGSRCVCVCVYNKRPFYVIMRNGDDDNAPARSRVNTGKNWLTLARARSDIGTSLRHT